MCLVKTSQSSQDAHKRQLYKVGDRMPEMEQDLAVLLLNPVKMEQAPVPIVMKRLSCIAAGGAGDCLELVQTLCDAGHLRSGQLHGEAAAQIHEGL